MKCCSNCFKPRCHCNRGQIEIDDLIYPAIYELNTKGYSTLNCCSGHEYIDGLDTCISFSRDMPHEPDSELFCFETYKYRNEYHTRRYILRPNPELIKTYKKKRTDKKTILKDLNKSLYKWAVSLPYYNEKNEGPDRCGHIEFPDSYFDDETFEFNTEDVCEAWMLIPHSSPAMEYIIKDFMSGISVGKPIYENIINEFGISNRFNSHSNYSYRRGNSIEKKLVFDASLNAGLQFGIEQFIRTDSFNIDEDNKWLVSYVNFSDPWYEDGYHYYGGVPTKAFYDEDLEDFLYDNSELSNIEILTWMFDKISEKDIELCVFTQGDVNIIFTNKRKFAYKSCDNRIAFIMGNYDYDYMDFEIMTPESKELFIFNCGTLLLRKEF